MSASIWIREPQAAAHEWHFGTHKVKVTKFWYPTPLRLLQRHARRVAPVRQQFLTTRKLMMTG